MLRNNPSGAFDPKEVARGMLVEAEHGKGPAATRKIVEDHLREHANYYSVLASVFKENPMNPTEKCVRCKQNYPCATARSPLTVSGYERAQHHAGGKFATEMAAHARRVKLSRKNPVRRPAKQKIKDAIEQLYYAYAFGNKALPRALTVTRPRDIGEYMRRAQSAGLDAYNATEGTHEQALAAADHAVANYMCGYKENPPMGKSGSPLYKATMLERTKKACPYSMTFSNTEWSAIRFAKGRYSWADTIWDADVIEERERDGQVIVRMSTGTAYALNESVEAEGMPLAGPTIVEKAHDLLGKIV